MKAKIKGENAKEKVLRNKNCIVDHEEREIKAEENIRKNKQKEIKAERERNKKLIERAESLAQIYRSYKQFRVSNPNSLEIKNSHNFGQCQSTKFLNM